MKHKQHKKIFICCLCAILGLTFAMPYLSYATTQEDYDANNKELESLRARQNEINSDIASLNQQINDVGNKLSSINSKISEKQMEIDQLQGNIDSLNSSIASQYSAMKLRIKYMYEHNNEDTIELLLASKSLSEMLVRTEYVAQISDYDRNMLKQLDSTMLTLKNTSTQLENDLSQLTALRSEAQTQVSDLNGLLSSAQSAYASNADDISQSEALALEYEKKLEAERIAREQAAIDSIISSSNDVIIGTPMEYTDTDLAMLAAIIECEAGNQPYEGLLAVGSVIVNRVNNPRFDNTIAGVIYAPYQFSPVASGRFAIVLARGATARCVEAAKAVLDGNININALYFRPYSGSADLKGTVIGDHVFY